MHKVDTLRRHFEGIGFVDKKLCSNNNAPGTEGYCKHCKWCNGGSVSKQLENNKGRQPYAMTKITVAMPMKGSDCETERLVK